MLLRAMYEARQLYIADGDLRAAAELYDREAAAEADPERRSALLLELAALYRDELNDFDGAVSALQRAHGSTPADAGLSYELAMLLIQRAERADQRTAQGDYAQMADLMCGIADAVDPDQAIALSRDCARLCAGPRCGAERARATRCTAAPTPSCGWPSAGSHISPPHRMGKTAPQRRVALARAYMRQEQIEDAVFCVEPAAETGYEPAVALLRELRGTGGAELGPPSAPARPSSTGAD